MVVCPCVPVYDAVVTQLVTHPLRPELRGIAAIECSTGWASRQLPVSLSSIDPPAASVLVDFFVLRMPDH